MNLIPKCDYFSCLGDLMNLDAGEVASILSLLEFTGLKRIIDELMRVTDTNSTFLDLIIVSEELTIEVSGAVSVPDISDHHYVFCELLIPKYTCEPTVRELKYFRSMNYDQFYADLQ